MLFFYVQRVDVIETVLPLTDFIHKAHSCLPVLLKWTFCLPKAEWFQLCLLARLHNHALFLSLSWTATVVSIKAA